MVQTLHNSRGLLETAKQTVGIVLGITVMAVLVLIEGETEC
jgi:hypothetical protein